MSANLWNGPPPTYDSHSTTSFRQPTLPPYLTLPHRLSLAWLATPILSLAFVAFRLLLSLDAAQTALERTKADLLSSCLAAEKAATGTASMPRYMALATNKQFADAINGSIDGARAGLILALTIMEGVMNFIIDMYRSTFLCFLELVVKGGLEILIGAVGALNQAVQVIAAGLRTSIQQDVTNANSVIQGFVTTINKIPFASKVTAPQINVPSLDSLQNVTIPSSFQDALIQLNNSIPSASDIKDKLDAVLDTPFELVKKDINDTFLGLYFDANVLPVPAQDTVTFCNNLDTSVVDDLGLDLIRIVKIGIIILIIIALVLVGLNCILTWYRWRSLKRHLEFTRQAWTTDPAIAYLEAPPQEWKTEPTITHSQLFAPSRPWTTDVTPSATPRALTTDLTPSGTPRAYTTDLTPLPSPQALMTPTITHPQPLASPQALTTDHTITQSQPPVSAPQVTLSDHNLMMLGANSEHPLITRIMHQLAAKLNLTPRQHVHTRWFLNYIFYAPARVCFLIGFFGLLSVEIQLFAMNPLAAKYRTRAQATVSDFSDLIATSINASMYNQSSFYAGQVNSRVDTVQDTINNGLFGWVNGTTTTLNNTINEFYTDVQNAVTLIFGNTILEEPAQEFIKCFIGGKVDAIENAITFMHNNLQVDMPRVNESVLVLSQSSVNEATAPIAAAAVGNGSNGSEGFLGQVIQDYVATLKKERLMFAIYMGIWGVVCLMGLVILLRHSFGNPNTKEKVEEEDLPSDKEKEPVDDAPPPSKREFKPSWLKKPKPRTCNLLAVIRDAFGRIPRLKLPKMEVELPTPDVGAWYDKTRGLLKREDKQETEQPLKLDIPRRDSSTQSRFSISPATTPSWKNLLPPLKKPSMPSVVVTPPQSPKRRETRDDVVSLRLSVQSTTPLIPLRPNGDYQLTPPKRWKGAAAQSQSTTSSSKLVKFQLPLAAPQPSLLSQYSRSPTPRLLPKTPGKSAPLGSRMSDPTQWRVTNDIPEEPSRNSAESLSKIPDNNFPVITMSRVDVRNSALNPFITPFDDECRVRIEEPSLEGLRKSVHTGS